MAKKRILQAQGDVAIAVFVVLLEDVRHALQADAGLHEEVEADSVLPSPVIGAVKQSHELRREPVTKGNECFAELGIGNLAGTIYIKSIKETAPGREKAPEAAVEVSEDVGKLKKLQRTKIHRS